MVHEPLSVLREPRGTASETREPPGPHAPWFAAWAERMEIGLAIADADLRFLALNDAFARMLGKPPAAILGQSLLEAAPDTPSDLPARLRAVLETGEPLLRLELPGPRSGRHWRASYRRIDGPTGQRVLAIDIEEITSRKQAEERLHLLLEAKELFATPLAYDVVLDRLARILVPELSDWCAVDVLDEAGEFLTPVIAHVDPAMVAMAHELRLRFPMRPDDATGPMNVRRTGKAELFPEIPDALLAASAHDAEHLRIARALGMRSALVVPLYGSGKVLGAITLVSTQPGRRYDEEDLALAQAIADRAGVAIDNARLFSAMEAARRQAEETAQRVRRMQELSEALAGAGTPEGVAEVIARQLLHQTAASRVVVTMNSHDGLAQEIIADAGYSAAVMDRYRHIAADAPLPLGVVQHTRQPVFVETPDEYLARFPEVTAPNSAAIAAYPLLDPGGDLLGTFGVGFDEARRFPAEDRALFMTIARQGAQALDRARLHEAERRARVAAEEANRMKDEFLSVVSHELRTPLNAIVGWTALLEKRSSDAAFLAKGLASISRNARSQTTIIEDILDVSRIVSGKLKLDRGPVDLATVLGAAADVVRPTAETKGITLEMRVELVPVIAGDPDRIQQVLWNLLANALKFTAQGGRVEAALGRDASTVRVMVTDTGEGIDPKFLPFVFDRFRQADATQTRRHGGLGLGLAIVRHLVDLHGGRVLAESEGVGRGARFSVWLPIPAVQPRASARSQLASRPEQPTEETPAPSLVGLRVLVVDDEQDAREVVTEVLGERGAEVVSAGSAEEAVRMLATSLPDVILSDLGMPHEDGFALLRRVRLLSPRCAQIPAVALTAYARDEDAIRAREAGFAAHLSKPIDPARMCVVLARIAAGLAAQTGV